ncbi:retrovirus-related pol polyprotein from transposon TNT 1-94 [Tanacetum coccineum]
MLTRSMPAKLIAAPASECLFVDFLSEIEPKKVFEALKHQGWKQSKNVAQGYSQEEGIEYDETFATVARMEAIRIFLTCTTYMNFKVFQMDIKSAFLNGKLKKQIYVKPPTGFESSEFHDYDLILKGTQTQTLKDAIWTKKALQVHVNFLVFCFTVVVELPRPPTEDFNLIPLKESGIRFIVRNGKTPLYLDFKTFCQSIGLDYNNGTYVTMPQTEAMKVELLKLGLHNDRNETETRNVLGGNKSSTYQVNFNQQMIVFSILTEMKIDIREIIFNDLVTMLIDTPRKKYVACPRFISCVLERLLNTNYTQGTSLGSTPSIMMGKKNKYQIMTKTKPKSQGLEASEVPPKGIRTSSLLPKETPTDPQYPRRNIQLTGVGLPSMTSFKVEPDVILSIQSLGDFNAPMEDSWDDLLDLSDEEIFEAGDEMETDLRHKHKMEKKPKKSEPSSDPYDSESSSASLSFKDYDNYIPTTKRVLSKNLQGFSKVLYAQITEDN